MHDSGRSSMEPLGQMPHPLLLQFHFTPSSVPKHTIREAVFIIDIGLGGHRPSSKQLKTPNTVVQNCSTVTTMPCQ